MPDTLKLKFGTSAQIDAANYTAGTLYLAKKDASTADLYFDMGGTRLEITPSTLDSSMVEDLVEQVTDTYEAASTLSDDKAIDMIDDIWAGE